LNETGEQQVERLASRLKAEGIQAVYSSPLQRSLDTAQAIARYHQIEVSIEPGLVELNLGEIEGTMIEDLNMSFTELLITSPQGENLPRIPGGESLVEVQQRAWSTVQRLVSQHPDGTIAIVSHFFAILTIICAALTLPLPQIRRLRLSPGSISTLTFDGQTPRLVLFNDTCHLQPTEIP
jgi:probable phosphoglycerate mutase